MELLTTLLGQIITEMLPQVSAKELEPLLENKCLQILGHIQAVVRNADLDDPTCFKRIERIVCLLEDSEILCGKRHHSV